MKLTDLFIGDRQITDAGKAQVNTAKNDVVNRQIQSMVPGQTIQGEVVSRNGSEVQIRLADDLVLQARLDQNMNLEVGKNMTFEVKNNGKSLVLSPLFTNVATDANVLKALDMASLPLNGTTVALTKQLMEAGLSIDRNTLQQVYREVNLFPEAQTADIVNLHKLQMPVNEGNVSQMASYRNLTHQLVTGLNNVLDAIPDMFSHMMESGNADGAVKLYQQLVLMAGEGSAAATANILFDGAVQGGMSETILMGQSNIQGNPIEGAVAQAKNLVGETLLDIPLAGQNGEAASVINEISGENIASQNTQGTNIISDLTSAVNGAQENVNPAAQQLQSLLGQLSTDLSAQSVLAHLNQMMQGGSAKAFLEPLLQLLKQQWTITPEDVADPEQVEGLYRRLDKQLKNLAQAMENSGQTATNAYKAVTNMTQNLDFLQQVNQLYTYVQLPLRMQNGEAHGDLYVYTNKKHLSAKDGQMSALLHLDMEYLGPVDVYVSMMQEKVNTKFYLQDDDLLDFMMEHMDILTERLQKRGYQCSYEMQVRKQGEEAKTGIQKLLQHENHVPLAEYAFDVRT